MQDFIFSMKFSLCHVQALFLELRKIEKYELENVFEVNCFQEQRDQCNNRRAYDPLILLTFVKSTFSSAGLDPLNAINSRACYAIAF
jgi:hypothetical protein